MTTQEYIERRSQIQEQYAQESYSVKQKFDTIFDELDHQYSQENQIYQIGDIISAIKSDIFWI